ncbi:hypothetical protein D049_1284A, partial [Vibrio parahaemolyticus VPTS-2010]
MPTIRDEIIFIHSERH